MVGLPPADPDEARRALYHAWSSTVRFRALKNAIDVGSRPYGQGPLIGKPCAVISQSPGALGGFGANHHLRQPLVFLDMPAMQQPEAYIGNAAKLFDEQGTLNNEATREFLTKFMQSLRPVGTCHV